MYRNYRCLNKEFIFETPSKKLQYPILFFQGILVQHNTKNGVIISSNTLVLQKIKRQVAGNYSCAASSVEGDGKSNYVQLRVMCKYLIFSIFLLFY